MLERADIGKRFFMGILVIGGLAFPLKGQQLKAGFFAGVNASQVEGDTYSGFNKLGPTAGAFLNRLIDFNIYWQAELKYGIRGVYEGPDENSTDLYRSSYHVVELALSVHYLYQNRVMVEMGTSPELLVAARFRDENGIMDPSTYPDNRRLGLSVFAGLGYCINEKLVAGLRYTNSAIPFRKPEEWNNPQYRGYFHNVITLSLAYSFIPD
jgi:hypothetical protein